MMNFRKWFRRRTSTPALLQSSSKPDRVREFVYLDEVSVYSLASSAGRIPATALTESDSSEKSDSLGTTAGASAPFAKAELQTQMAHKRSRGTQIERKFNIQATFDQIHHDLDGHLILRPIDKLPPLSEDISIEQMIADLRAAGLASPASELTRGSLIELNIELASHRVYELTSAMADFGDMMAGGQSLTAGVDVSLPQRLLELSQLLNRFLVDLVPIEGVVQDYEVVELSGELFVVPVALLEAAPLAHLHRSQLVVVGVAEKDLFWKNTRRVLFSELRYDAMARIAHSGLRTKWTPVKLLDAFRRALPDADLSDLDLFLDPDAVTSVGGANTGGTMAGIAQDLYQRLANHHQVLPTSENTNELEARFVGQSFDISTMSTRLAQLSPVIDQFYADWPEATEDMDAIAPLRMEAIAHYDLVSPAAGPTSSINAAPAIGLAKKYYLEAEFIGLYW